jgi:MFS family permease
MTAAHAVPHRSMFSAMQHRDFRWYFGGQLISISGTWMQSVAEGWLVFQLTRSELALGAVAFAAGIPSLLLSPFAGAVVDSFPRRTILLVTQAVQMLLSVILTVLVFTNSIQVWHIMILAFMLGVTRCVDSPARQSFIKDMVGTEDMSSGITLNSIMVNGGRIVGPAMAGFFLASVGAGWCFFFNAASFLAVLISLLAIHPRFHVPNTAIGSPLVQVREGLSFSRRHNTILPLLLLAAVGSSFAANTVTLLPALADIVLHAPVDGLSMLSVAQGGGAVIAGLILTRLVNRVGHGRVISAMVLLLSLSMILLAQSRVLELSALLMVVFGFGFVLFFVNTNTVIQYEVPDAVRGRVMSLFSLTFLGLTPLSALVIGGLANIVGTPEALVICGILNGVLGLAILLRWRDVWRLA